MRELFCLVLCCAVLCCVVVCFVVVCEREFLVKSKIDGMVRSWSFFCLLSRPGEGEGEGELESGGGGGGEWGKE